MLLAVVLTWQQRTCSTPKVVSRILEQRTMLCWSQRPPPPSSSSYFDLSALGTRTSSFALYIALSSLAMLMFECGRTAQEMNSVPSPTALFLFCLAGRATTRKRKYGVNCVLGTLSVRTLSLRTLCLCQSTVLSP